MHACMERMCTFVSVAFAVYTIQRCMFLSHSVACINRCVDVLRRTEHRTQNIYDCVPSLVFFGRAIFVAWILLTIVVCLCHAHHDCMLSLDENAPNEKHLSTRKKNQQNALNIKKQSLWKSNRAVFFVALIVVFGWFCFVLLSLKDEYVIDKSDFVVVFQSIALCIHSRWNGWMLDFFHLDTTVNNVHSAFLCSRLASGVLLRK